MGGLDVISTLLSLLMVVVSFRRQKFIAYDAELISISSVTVKWLICSVLYINALALMFRGVAILLPGFFFYFYGFVLPVLNPMVVFQC
ncbi:hypothetical protein RHD99_13670 [Buttiauxella selenatireducens]|uniref:Uncharacterized protein n=1 Tax=Buttiauxella selenatireducens TaxID=3073902 RepID=A0ABY9S8Z7_9ENTR|nr:hypothetical protein [Buttiauxella sp. R73]WMY72532.1 hypothetical protein RHD99_13670 [Buttiauxella sp. R73]